MSRMSPFVIFLLSSLMLVGLAAIIILLVETKDKCLPYIGEGDAIGTESFVEIGEGWYLIEANDTVNWYEANMICRRHKAQLASIETEFEMNNLISYFNKNYLNEQMWLSGTNLHKEGEYVWMGTGQPLDYTYWDKGHPDNGVENCILVWREDHGWKWNVGSCDTTMGYICEREKPARSYKEWLKF